jgi:predicted DsbA family dithiol-disulfide isomerase
MKAEPPVKLRVWIDFVCPYCLLAKTAIRQSVEGLNVEIEWMPFELRPYPTPTLRPEDEYLPSAWKHGVYPLAERMGIEIKLPTISPQPYTRAAFLGLEYATHHGKGDAYVDGVLRAFFQEDQDIGDRDVLKRISQNLGLAADGIDEIQESPDANAKHDAALQFARQIGIRAVPSVGVDDVIFSGIPNANSLRATILNKAASAR